MYTESDRKCFFYVLFIKNIYLNIKKSSDYYNSIWKNKMLRIYNIYIIINFVFLEKENF